MRKYIYIYIYYVHAYINYVCIHSLDTQQEDTYIHMYLYLVWMVLMCIWHAGLSPGTCMLPTHACMVRRHTTVPLHRRPPGSLFKNPGCPSHAVQFDHERRPAGLAELHSLPQSTQGRSSREK